MDTSVGVCVDAGSGSRRKSEQYEEEGQGRVVGATPEWWEIRVSEDKEIWGGLWGEDSAT